MKYYILILSFALNLELAAQLNQQWIDPSGNVKLLGEITDKRLSKKPFNEWYNKNYKEYNPSEEILNILTSKSGKIDSIKIFMGTWCGDSKRGIPQFYKVLNESNLNKKEIQLVAVDRGFNAYKQSPNGEEIGLNIHRVPTMIIYKEGEELGRIVESPKESWELDLVNILEKNYEPNYVGVIKVNALLEDDSEIDKDLIAKELKDIVSSKYELNTYGYKLLTSWNIEDAITVFEINCKIFENESSTHFMLAKVHNLVGNKQECIKCLKTVLEIEPDHENASTLLASLEN